MGLSRLELLRTLQIIKTVQPILKEAYEEAAFTNDRTDDWHKSFHASSFPLEESMACPRKAVYNLCGLPMVNAPKHRGVALMEAGLDIEQRIIYRLKEAGVLISSPNPEDQTNFKIKKYWLVGHTDAIILPPNANRPHVLEIKTKSQEVVNEMKKGTRIYDYQHKGQLMAYIYFTRIGHKLLGFEERGLEKCIDGTILYISRDDPSNIAEFIIQYDHKEVKNALARLESYKDDYLNNVLPARPKNFWWTSEPCKWCDFKKGCKQDYQDKVTNLEESKLIKDASTIQSDYDLNKVRQTITSYWD